MAELTTEELKETSPEELAEHFGSEEPQKSATPTGDAPTEPEYDFEFDSGDGSGVKRYTTEQMAQDLGNYNKLQSTVGSQANDIGEYKRRQTELEEQLKKLQSGDTVVIQGQSPNVDYDDPDVIQQAVQAIRQENASLKKQIDGMPDEIKRTAERVAEDRAVESEKQRVTNAHPKLKKYEDPVIRENFVRDAARWALSRNEAAGREIYKDTDVDAVVDAYMNIVEGGQEPVKMQAFVRNLRSSGGEVNPASGGKALGDVVQRYKALTTGNERAEFLSTLSEDEEKLIDNAVNAGEIT